MGISICQITKQSGNSKIRIEGTYVRDFYEKLKLVIPKHYRAYFPYPSGPYWLVDVSYFYKVFEMAYSYFSKIQLFEDYKAEEYLTGKNRSNGVR